MTPPLHPYQQRLVNKLLTMPRGALFLEMGLGKTAIILTLITKLIEKYPKLRFLIIAPPAVASLTYPAEITKWAPQLSYKVITSQRLRHRPKAIKEEHHDIGLASNMTMKWIETQAIYRHYNGLIVDESSTVFSNHASMNFKHLKNILHNFPLRYIMTGTPVPNSYEQLWSQFFILDNGERLDKDFFTFRRQYFVPNRFNRFKYSLVYKADIQIMDKIKDITFALKMQDVALELPPITHTIIPTELPDYLDTIYKDFKKNYITTCIGTEVNKGTENENSIEGLHYNQFDIKDFTLIADTGGVLIEKLLQFCSGGIYTKENPNGYVRIHELKADTLGTILSELSGKALLLYRYRHESDLILSKFPNDVTLYNGNPSHISKWQAGETPRVLMSHPRSIATGLNLQHDTDTIIWMGFTWDLQQWQQTNARLHRPGQTRPVRVLYIATGEMEYQLLTRLKDKDKMLLNFMTTMKTTGQAGDIKIPTDDRNKQGREAC